MVSAGREVGHKIMATSAPTPLEPPKAVGRAAITLTMVVCVAEWNVSALTQCSDIHEALHKL